MKRPGPFGCGQQPAEPEDDAALVLPRHLDRREREQQQQEDDDREDDQRGVHLDSLDPRWAERAA